MTTGTTHGFRKPTMNLLLVTSEVCQVACKTCPASRPDGRSSVKSVMSLEMATRIVEKAQRETNLVNVTNYYFNEPTLVPGQVDIINMVHSKGLDMIMSSNLSVPTKLLPPFIETGLSHWIISVSGFHQATAERSHKKSDIELVKTNMRLIAKTKKPSTFVMVSFHRYKYNAADEVEMRAFCAELGFRFVPYFTGLLPIEAVDRVWETGVDHPGAIDIQIPVLAAKEMCEKRKHFPCKLQDQFFAVNADGVYYNCCDGLGTANLRGSIFDTTFPEALARRRTDAACVACKAKGLHVYANQAYTRHPLSPAVLAEFWYHRLGLGGRWKRFSKFAIRHLYRRPNKKGIGEL